MKSLAFSVVCIVLLCAGASAAESSWNVEFVPAATNTLKGTTKPYADVITVKDGQLSSKVAGQQGFAAAKCDIKTEPGKTKFVADLTSAEHGKNHYELELTKDGLTGTMKWGKMGEDGKPKEANYTVKEKKK